MRFLADESCDFAVVRALRTSVTSFTQAVCPPEVSSSFAIQSLPETTCSILCCSSSGDAGKRSPTGSSFSSRAVSASGEGPAPKAAVLH